MESMPTIHIYTHQTPIGQEASASPDARLHHLQADVVRDLDMVPVVVYGVDELHKGNQVPGEDEHARFVQLDVRHGVVLRGWYMVTPFNPNQLLSFVSAYVSLSLPLAMLQAKTQGKRLRVGRLVCIDFRRHQSHTERWNAVQFTGSLFGIVN